MIKFEKHTIERLNVAIDTIDKKHSRDVLQYLHIDKQGTVQATDGFRLARFSELANVVGEAMDGDYLLLKFDRPFPKSVKRILITPINDSQNFMCEAQSAAGSKTTVLQSIKGLYPDTEQIIEGFSEAERITAVAGYDWEYLAMLQKRLGRCGIVISESQQARYVTGDDNDFILLQGYRL